MSRLFFVVLTAIFCASFQVLGIVKSDSFASMPRPRTISQTERYYSDNDCGPVSLAVVCAIRNINVSLEQLHRMIHLGPKGCRAASLLDTANKLGLIGTGVKCNAKALAKQNQLAIIELKKGHFAVFVRADAKTGKLLVIDLPEKPYYVGVDELDKQWGGRAILFPEPLCRRREMR